MHIGKVHSRKCAKCHDKFIEEEKYEGHLKLEILLDNICDTKLGNDGPEISKHRTDETCLAVFSTTIARDDDLPVLYLHSFHCWQRSDRKCPDLPESITQDNHE